MLGNKIKILQTRLIELDRSLEDSKEVRIIKAFSQEELQQLSADHQQDSSVILIRCFF